AGTHPSNGFRKKIDKYGDCQKIFTCRSSLICHQQVHLGEKPFKYPECGKSFVNSTSLQQQEMTHTKETPFLCTT
ncbi:PREDICTED: zinc finger protein OZF-like, partial [Apaloderma vittatum]|uniref:zinc finger protein OZF-like n=1 Tax=Apaloderma vittatum TaxID=57397 RepID=UPI000521202A